MASLVDDILNVEVNEVIKYKNENGDKNEN